MFRYHRNDMLTVKKNNMYAWQLYLEFIYTVKKQISKILIQDKFHSLRKRL